eukprot:CAMPEP_0118969458 /NCGR_PEP_ID=MMETSP1173-20130426/6554_1 /TAXON_ID=1034831 /ORGANISM="Rhizochromulina marina cf, Strain CCMP1243" /LENGTH=133 /DNA_ID=CAMNT_0006918703 /DNA_START=91 /DNA_END=493 /DNA_ORIENTATION=-
MKARDRHPSSPFLLQPPLDLGEIFITTAVTIITVASLFVTSISFCLLNVSNHDAATAAASAVLHTLLKDGGFWLHDEGGSRSLLNWRVTSRPVVVRFEAQHRGSGGVIFASPVSGWLVRAAQIRALTRLGSMG